MIAASGVMIQLHYCGQELDSWNLFASEAEGCDGDDCDDTSDDSDCCSDEVITAKISQDQHSTSTFKYDFSVVDIALPPQTYAPYTIAFTHSKEKGLLYHANAPPGLWQNIPLYKLNTNFTFYG